MAGLKQASALLQRTSPHSFSFLLFLRLKKASRGKAQGRQDVEIMDTTGNIKRASMTSFLVIFYEYFVCLNLFLTFIGVQARDNELSLRITITRAQRFEHRANTIRGRTQ